MHTPQVMKPMVKIAREVIKENGYDTVISVVGKRSTETTAGEGRINVWYRLPLALPFSHPPQERTWPLEPTSWCPKCLTRS